MKMRVARTAWIVVAAVQQRFDDVPQTGACSAGLAIPPTAPSHGATDRY
jgi:hypothetical protein